MTKLGFLFQSSVGRKYVMGITGIALFLFVIAHMIGNLQIYLGPEAINAYAETLQGMQGLLWIARIGLLAIVILHIVSALQLAAVNRRARPTRYDRGKPPAASYASRTILLSGIIILAFIIFHLLHFTIGLVDPNLLQLRDHLGRHDVYGMMIRGFSNPLVSIFYIVAMALLCLHLSHGVSSAFQSLGLRSSRTLRIFQRIATISAVVIFIGNCSIPLAILAGLTK